MKHFTILSLLLVLCNGSMRAQVITITFEATLNGSSIPLDSILVMNLTAGGDTTIYFPDNVLVLGSTDIGEALFTDRTMHALPNPFASSTEIAVETKGGAARILLHDMAGRELVSLATNLSVGVHRLRVSCARPGVHLLSVVQGGVRRTMRLMATEGAGVNVLSLLSQEQRVRAKSDRSLFTWTPSDELRYIGYATDAGIVNSAVIDEVPVATATRTFELFAGRVCPESPTVTDIDGNVYTAVQIGAQCWMAENLKTSRYRDGGTIPNVTDNTAWTQLNSDAWCSYNNSQANEAIYGKLYNWFAAANPNMCPQGWHVPTESEWQQLELALDMPAGGVNFTGWLGTAQNVGGKMKATTLWNASNTGATNESGFSGLPGGGRGDGGGYFYYLGGFGHWWSASESDAEFAWYRGLSNSQLGVDRFIRLKWNGFSLRCVRD
jgi:uncharacterized protein (TIGR02145 family)